MPLDKPLSPQGYNIGVDPVNQNPFFDYNGGGGGEGTTDYNQLHNRPFVNGKVLLGNENRELTTPEQLAAVKTELEQQIENIELTPGPPGEDGAPGKDGAPGPAGKIVAVSAETVPYTEPASVTNTGTEENANLHFKIPQGAPGEGGGGGSTITVNVGTTTTGEPGTYASVTNTGTEENIILDFTIPRGATGAPGTNGTDGAPGKDGAPGPAGKIVAVSAETVPYTEPASVTNTGTEENANLHFKIPQGAPGDGGGGGGGGGTTYTKIGDYSCTKTPRVINADFKPGIYFLDGIVNYFSNQDSYKTATACFSTISTHIGEVPYTAMRFELAYKTASGNNRSLSIAFESDNGEIGKTQMTLSGEVYGNSHVDFTLYYVGPFGVPETAYLTNMGTGGVASEASSFAQSQFQERE